MTFDTIRKMAIERSSEVIGLLNHIAQAEAPAGNPASVEVKIMRGLFFVQLYGTLEKVTTEALQQLLRDVDELQPQNCHVIMPFNVVSMSRRWKSLKDSGYKDALSRVREFFLAIEEDKFHGVEESLFAEILQNIWSKTIDDIILVLGISGFNLSLSDRALIDELVRHRNSVAHGRESPLTIGERYRCDDLRKKQNEVHVLILKLIDRLEAYIQNREFVATEYQGHYLQESMT